MLLQGRLLQSIDWKYFSYKTTGCFSIIYGADQLPAVRDFVVPLLEWENFDQYLIILMILSLMKLYSKRFGLNGNPWKGFFLFNEATREKGEWFGYVGQTSYRKNKLVNLLKNLVSISKWTLTQTEGEWYSGSCPQLDNCSEISHVHRFQICWCLFVTDW